jgi:hypothetical protein
VIQKRVGERPCQGRAETEISPSFSPRGPFAQNPRQESYLESNDCLTHDECFRPVEDRPFEGRVKACKITLGISPCGTIVENPRQQLSFGVQRLWQFSRFRFIITAEKGSPPGGPMRLATLFCLLLALSGFSAAQDTNFPVGPQYLITRDSPMFLQPIATPTLSLSTPPPSAAEPALATEPVPEAPSTSPVPLSQPDLASIYWGENVTGKTSASSEIELSSTAPPSVPASILDTGVTGTTDAQSLRQRGYGVPLGDTASFWKSHKPHATRSYTNADVARLHQS